MPVKNHLMIQKQIKYITMKVMNIMTMMKKLNRKKMF
jgi:hypothetical protein